MHDAAGLAVCFCLVLQTVMLLCKMSHMLVDRVIKRETEPECESVRELASESVSERACK